MENMSLSDIAAVTKDNDDYFGNGGMWIFALLILMMMGGGGYWSRGNQSEPVTEAGLCNAMNFNGLENSVGRLNDSLKTITWACRTVSRISVMRHCETSTRLRTASLIAVASLRGALTA